MPKEDSNVSEWRSLMSSLCDRALRMAWWPVFTDNDLWKGVSELVQWCPEQNLFPWLCCLRIHLSPASILDFQSFPLSSETSPETSPETLNLEILCPASLQRDPASEMFFVTHSSFWPVTFYLIAKCSFSSFTADCCPSPNFNEAVAMFRFFSFQKIEQISLNILMHAQ